MRRLSAVINFLSVLVALWSCQKEKGGAEQDISKHYLETEDETTVKKNQAIELYDATSLSDSASFVNPPANKQYQWRVIPDDGCVIFSGKYKNGLAVVTFGCAGRYQLFAAIYDSVSQQVIAATDTMTVDVTNDILYPGQPIKTYDVLTLRPSIVKVWNEPHSSNIDPPDEVYMQIIYSTTHQYEYNSAYNNIELKKMITANNYGFNFSDTVTLQSYPFSNGNGHFSTVQGGIDLKGLSFGVPANLSVGWLGKTYTGKVTLINQNQYSFQWDNTGQVKVN